MTGANGILVAVHQALNSGQTVTGVTDTEGNTYDLIQAGPNSSGQIVEVYFAKNATTDASVTVTATFSASAFASISVAAYSGTDPTTPIQTSSTVTDSGASPLSGSMNFNNVDSLLIACATARQNSSWTPGTGQTTRASGTDITGGIITEENAPILAPETQEISYVATVQNGSFVAIELLPGPDGEMASDVDISLTSDSALEQPPGQTIHLFRRTGGAVAVLPTTTWADPTSPIFPTAVRNDDTRYSFDSANHTVTLPTGNLADGYLIVASFEFEDTSNGRHNPVARIVQTAGTGDFISAQTSGYNRDASEDRAYVRVWAFVNNPSDAAEFQFQWKRDTDVPTGGTVLADFEVTSLYYNNIGMYSSASTTQPATTTPTVITGFSSIVESDTNSIELVSNSPILRGDNKKYLFLGSYYYEGNYTNRTQRLGGLAIDNVMQDHIQGYSYLRNESNNLIGEFYSWIVRTETAAITLNNRLWKGPDTGTFPNYGCTVGGTATGANPLHTMVVLELPDDAEIFTTINASQQDIDVAGTRLALDVVTTTNFEGDSASFTRAEDRFVNVEQDMDVLCGANVTGGYASTSTARYTGYAEFSKNNVGITESRSGDYGRGDQGTNDTWGWSANLLSFHDFLTDEDLGLQAGKIAGGESGTVDVLSGFVGFWGINLQSTLPATTPSGDMASTIDIELTSSSGLNADGQIESDIDVELSTSATLSGDQVAEGAANINIELSTSSDLSADGNLDSDIDVELSTSSTLSADGEIASTVEVFFTPDVTISGDVVVNGAADIDIELQSSSDISADGSMASVVNLSLTPDASVSADASMASVIEISFTPDADLSSEVDGDINSSVILQLTPAATLAADGSISSTISISLAPDANIESDTDASSTIEVSLSSDATISSDGSLSAAVEILFDLGSSGISGNIDGNADAAIDISFTPSATLSAEATMASTIELSLTPTVGIKADGLIEGVSNPESEIPYESAVLEMRFNGNVLDTTGINTGITTNASYTSSIYGAGSNKAILSDSQLDEVKIPDNDVLSFHDSGQDQEFTIFWATRIDNITANNWLATKRFSASTNREWDIFAGGGNQFIFLLRDQDNDRINITFSQNVVEGVAEAYAVTYNGNRTPQGFKGYRDAVFDTEASKGEIGTYEGTWNGNGEVTLLTLLGGNHINGVVEIFLIFHAEMSAAAVQNIQRRIMNGQEITPFEYAVADLSADGLIESDVTISLTTDATIEGELPSELESTIEISLTPIVGISADGLIESTVEVSMATSGNIEAAIDIESSIDISLTTIASLSADANIQSTSLIEFIPDATMQAFTSILQGSADISLSTSLELLLGIGEIIYLNSPIFIEATGSSPVTLELTLESIVDEPNGDETPLIIEIKLNSISSTEISLNSIVR